MSLKNELKYSTKFVADNEEEIFEYVSKIER